MNRLTETYLGPHKNGERYLWSLPEIILNMVLRPYEVADDFDHEELTLFININFEILSNLKWNDPGSNSIKPFAVLNAQKRNYMWHLINCFKIFREHFLSGFLCKLRSCIYVRLLNINYFLYISIYCLIVSVKYTER